MPSKYCTKIQHTSTVLITWDVKKKWWVSTVDIVYEATTVYGIASVLFPFISNRLTPPPVLYLPRCVNATQLSACCEWIPNWGKTAQQHVHSLVCNNCTGKNTLLRNHCLQRGKKHYSSVVLRWNPATAAHYCLCIYFYQFNILSLIEMVIILYMHYNI